MRIGSAVDGQDYYVIKNEAGEYLRIVDSRRQAEEAIVAWGERLSAAQWYRAMPDRVHVFDAFGKFLYGWCVGLDAAQTIMGMHGGHLVHVRVKRVPRRRKPPTPRLTVWDRIAGRTTPKPD